MQGEPWQKTGKKAHLRTPYFVSRIHPSPHVITASTFKASKSFARRKCARTSLAMAAIYIVTLDDIPEGKRNVYTLSEQIAIAPDSNKTNLETTATSPPPLPPRDPATEDPTATDLESG